MIQVNDSYIDADMRVILQKLKEQLYENGIDVFHKFVLSGDNLQTTCPFHKDGKERKPSFGIMLKDKGNYKAGQCHCFACGWSGSLQEMISNCFGYDDMGLFGGKWLIQNFLTMSIETRTEIDLNLDRKVKEEVKYISDDEYDKFRYYHPYMYKRKMNDRVIDIFDIGYDKDTECIAFPVRDIEGRILFIARRSVKTKFFQYPKNVEKPVYGVYELQKEKEKIYKDTGMIPLPITDTIIICESMINCITCWVYGKYAVALNGTGDEYQYKQLRQMPNRKFILALDPDNAGKKGTEKLKKALTNKIVTQYIIPQGKDINDLTLEEFNNLTEIF